MFPRFDTGSSFRECNFLVSWSTCSELRDLVSIKCSISVSIFLWKMHSSSDSIFEFSSSWILASFASRAALASSSLCSRSFTFSFKISAFDPEDVELSSLQFWWLGWSELNSSVFECSSTDSLPSSWKLWTSFQRTSCRTAKLLIESASASLSAQWLLFFLLSPSSS